MLKGDRANMAVLVLAVTVCTMLVPACVTSGPGQATDTVQAETSGEGDFRNTPPKPGMLPETLEQIRRSRFVALAPDEARGPDAGLLVNDAGKRMDLVIESGGLDGTWVFIDGDARFAYQITEKAYLLLTNPGLDIGDGKLIAPEGGVWALEAHWDGYAAVIPQ
jgi:hypothetical protein